MVDKGVKYGLALALIGFGVGYGLALLQTASGRRGVEQRTRFVTQSLIKQVQDAHRVEASADVESD